HRCFQQRRIENRLALVRKSLRDLLAHTRALQSQILVSESLLRQLEDVPLAAAETRRLRVVTDLHRAEQTGDELGWKVVVLQILFGRKADVAARAQAVNVFTPGACDSGEVSLALKLLVDVVDLQLRIRLVL